MKSQYVMMGRLTGPRHLELDESLPMTSTKVRVTVELIEDGPHTTYQEVMAIIRHRQEARGHRPPTKDEVDRFLSEERNGWE